MRVLVTGSSGFVGTALCTELRNRGHEVTGFSRQGRADSIQGDLLDFDVVQRALAELAPQVIYNLAAQTALKGEPEGGYFANHCGVSNLVRAAAIQPSVERVIWLSSQLVLRPGRTPRSDTDYDPTDRYGESKAIGEQIVRAADGGGKIWCIARSTTIWGPGMSEHYASVIRMIRRGLYFHVGHSPLRKSYSYIDNLTAQLASLAIVPGASIHRRTFYLADSEALELRAWANAFGEEFGRPVRTMPLAIARMLARVGDVMASAGLPAPINTRRLNNMLTEYLYDLSPINEVHGFTTISWREGVARTARWMNQCASRDQGEM